MLVERVPVSRPSTPEEPAESHPQQEHDEILINSAQSSVEDSGEPTSVCQTSTSYPTGLLYAPTAHNVYLHPGTHHYTTPEITPLEQMPSVAQHATSAVQYAATAAAASSAGFPQSLRMYETHYPPQRHPVLPAMYPTPPHPSPVRFPIVEQYIGGSNPQGMHVVQVPDLKPLTIYTERQACTALSPPTDLSNYGGRKPFKGLLMTLDGSVGGRRSPAPGAEAVMAGGVVQRLPAQARTEAVMAGGVVQRQAGSRKRGYEDDDNNHGNYSIPKKGRFTFSIQMLDVLEQRFTMGRYIAADERKALADKLGIADVQVKNWFQNRRMKWKRQNGGQKTRLQLPAQFPQLKRSNPPVFQHTQANAATSGQLVQLGNTAQLCQTPCYTTYTTSSDVAQLKSPIPIEFVANTGLPAFRSQMMQQCPPGVLYSSAGQFPAGVARYVDVKCDTTEDGE